MTAMELFNIRLDEPSASEPASRPEDPLGEFSSFEMGLKLACFERNHSVLMEIGNEKKYVYLYPDICSVIDTLPEEISNLSRGETVQFIFSEVGMLIHFAPGSENVVCTLRTFGYSQDAKSFECESKQVVEALSRFLNELLQLAVTGGYISQEESEQFLNQGSETEQTLRRGRYR
jgi:hypothetical protein